MNFSIGSVFYPVYFVRLRPMLVTMEVKKRRKREGDRNPNIAQLNSLLMLLIYHVRNLRTESLMNELWLHHQSAILRFSAFNSALITLIKEFLLRCIRRKRKTYVAHYNFGSAPFGGYNYSFIWITRCNRNSRTSVENFLQPRTSRQRWKLLRKRATNCCEKKRVELQF